MPYQNSVSKTGKKKYNIEYEGEQESEYDEQVFEMNAALIALMNSRPNKKFELELNEFASMTFDYFSSTFLGVRLPALTERGNIVTSRFGFPILQAAESFALTTIPNTIDYRNYSLAVKNQRNCGSCWAFAAISTLESRLKISNPAYNTTLSEQYLVDCDTRDYGCSGGWPITALNWILQSGGNAVPASAAYPYYGFRTKCRNTTKLSMNIIKTVQNQTAGNENMLKEIVANVGPIAVVVDVTNFFQLYKNGTFYDTTCNSNCASVNHAVVVVGYGTDPVTNFDYWIVKNSWGAAWGEQGYIYMARNRGNNCNIACWAMYAV